MDNYNKYLELKNTYKEIIYKSYKIEEIDNQLKLSFNFIIPNLTEFNPSITIDKNIITNKKIEENLLKDIVFHIGLIELISYYKAVCPEAIVIEAGYINEKEQEWFKKLYINGLGEFLYRNNIPINDNLFKFIIKGEKLEYSSAFQGIGNLIPVGGGKDSAVTLELLKDYKENNRCFIINAKNPSIKCCEIANYQTKDIYTVKRTIDKNLIELNKKGFLNGHTPFSAIVAFTSLLVAYLTNKENIALSNEDSANEATVINTNVNHQYSKSYEFEKDFYNYTKEHFKININYFSILRPIKEIQIAMLFSNYTKYHQIFKSCNLGSKEIEWNWCCCCPKCLFVYIILSPFIKEEEMIKIFGENLLAKKELEEIFLELIGKKETKPFECVGTIEEVEYALNLIIKKQEQLPYLVKLYKEKYYENIEIDLKHTNENNHNVSDVYYQILKKEILKCIDK